ncbi:hypothetical protein G6730_09010 [Polynucleobacter paneuropaeus]|nr:hypothetical protein [Polynucleobacter paneuropaeus]
MNLARPTKNKALECIFRGFFITESEEFRATVYISVGHEFQNEVSTKPISPEPPSVAKPRSAGLSQLSGVDY